VLITISRLMPKLQSASLGGRSRVCRPCMCLGLRGNTNDVT